MIVTLSMSAGSIKNTPLPGAVSSPTDNVNPSGTVISNPVINSEPSSVPPFASAIAASPVRPSISNATAEPSEPLTSCASTTGSSATASTIMLNVSVTLLVNPASGSVAVAVTNKPVRSMSLSAGGEKVNTVSKLSPGANTNVNVPATGSNTPSGAVTTQSGSIPLTVTVKNSFAPGFSPKDDVNGTSTLPSSNTNASSIPAFASTTGGLITGIKVTVITSLADASLFVRINSASPAGLSAVNTVTVTSIEPLNVGSSDVIAKSPISAGSITNTPLPGAVSTPTVGVNPSGTVTSKRVMTSEPSSTPPVSNAFAASPVSAATSTEIAVASSPLTSCASISGASTTASTIISKVAESVPERPVLGSVSVIVNKRSNASKSLFSGVVNLGPILVIPSAGSVIVQTPATGSKEPTPIKLSFASNASSDTVQPGGILEIVIVNVLPGDVSLIVETALNVPSSSTLKSPIEKDGDGGSSNIKINSSTVGSKLYCSAVAPNNPVALRPANVMGANSL